MMLSYRYVVANRFIIFMNPVNDFLTVFVLFVEKNDP